MTSSSQIIPEDLKNLAKKEQLEIPNAKDFPSKTVNEELLSTLSEKEQAHHYTRCTDSQIQYSTDAKSLFLIKKKTFSQQFSNLYFLRLKQMKPKLQQRAMKLYPDATLANRVLELKGDDEDKTSDEDKMMTDEDDVVDDNEDDEYDNNNKKKMKEEEANKKRRMYIVVGTLYKEMKLKPNILQEYTREEFNSKNQPTEEEGDEEGSGAVKNKSRISADDSMVLEDVSGRVSLLFADPTTGQVDALYHQQQVNELVTGIIVAVYGYVDSLGHFIVQRTIFSEYPTQVDRPIIPSTITPYVALVSGIGIGHAKFNLLNTQNMIDYLTGVIGGELEQDQITSRIVRVVIAGDSVWQDDSNHHKLFDVRGSLRPAERASLVEPSRAVDSLVEQLAQSVHVDVMPGENDPSNTSLPQQPLHPSMFPRSSQLSTCHLVTNPYTFEVMGGIQFLGISGQTIDDLKVYSSIPSSETEATGNTLELMEKTLKWSHLAPTAPDTLNCYPFYDHDPFILSSTPHVYFCGNQDKFETKLLSLDNSSSSSSRRRSSSSNNGNGKCVRLISLPRFVETGLIVLVNLRNLNVHPIVFDTEQMAL